VKNIFKQKKQVLANLAISVISIILIVYSSLLNLDTGSAYAFESRSLLTLRESASPERGLFLDRNGQVLTENSQVFDVFIKREKADEDLIAKINEQYELNLSFDSENLSDIKALDSLSKDQLNNWDQMLLQYEEVFYLKSYFIRNYTYPYLTSHLIGYIGEPDATDISKGKKPNILIGKYRLENQLESYLEGKAGRDISSELSNQSYSNIPGNNVYLTIDIDWQSKVYELLEDYNSRYGANGGAGVIIDTANGEVVSLVSYPSFNSNELFGQESSFYLSNLQEEVQKPLIDKAVSLSFTPGSIFKTFVSYYLLENSIVNKEDIYNSTGCITIGTNEFCEFGKNIYGLMNIERALVKSSNLFFCNYLSTQTVKSFNNLTNLASKLRLGELTGIDINGEAIGNIDSPEYKKAVLDEAWFLGDTCNLAIGQGAVTVTPLQMANLMNIFQNYGNYYPPHIVKNIISSEGEIVEYKHNEKSNLDLNKEYIDMIFEGMKGVAYNPESATYYFLNDLPNNIRAKTGSAETVEKIGNQFENRTHSWIIGLFDYKGKTYSFCFFQQYGGGGYYVTPLFADFLKYINSTE